MADSPIEVGQWLGGRVPSWKAAKRASSDDDYQEFRLDMFMRVRNHQPHSTEEFKLLNFEDQAAFQKLYRDYNRPSRPEPDTALKVVREKNGIQLVTGPFGSTGEPDEFYYHVTPRPNVQAIMGQGFSPARGRQTMADGAYRDYSKGKVFFCDRNGVDYWEEKIHLHLEHEQDNVPALAVLRFPKGTVSGLQRDTLGTSDSGANCWYSESAVKPIAPAPEDEDA
jgi:hypothetical protein